MLFLRVCNIDTYGQSHCEGILKSYKNYPLDQSMTLEQLEKFIKSKVDFKGESFSIEIMEDEEDGK